MIPIYLPSSPSAGSFADVTLCKVREERQREAGGGRLAGEGRGFGGLFSFTFPSPLPHLIAGSLPIRLPRKAEQSPPVPEALFRKEAALSRAGQNFQQSSGMPPGGSALLTQKQLFSASSQDLGGH